MLLSSLLAAAGCRYSTSGMTQTRRAADERLEAELVDDRLDLLDADEVALALEHVQVGVHAARARSHSGQAPQPPQDATRATPSSRANSVLARPSGPASR